MQQLQKYNKFIVAIVGFAVIALSTQYSTADWFQPLVSLLTALGVYQVKNG